MYCSNCGSVIDDSSLYCPNCAMPVSAPAAAPSSTATPAPAAAPSSTAYTPPASQTTAVPSQGTGQSCPTCGSTSYLIVSEEKVIPKKTGSMVFAVALIVVGLLGCALGIPFLGFLPSLLFILVAAWGAFGLYCELDNMKKGIIVRTVRCNNCGTQYKLPTTKNSR